MTTEMISKLSTIATRWTKNGMDRLYINIDAANELYTSIEDRAHGQLTLNRRERSMGKIWIEIESGEICTKGISDIDEVASEIEEIIAYLCPVAEETTGDATEEEQTMTTICPGFSFTDDTSFMSDEQIDALKNSINDYVFDNWYTLDQDPEHLEYELDDFHFDENGNPSCFIKFPDDDEWYTIVDINGNVYMY